MKTFKFEPYRGMKPSNHETMDALLRMRFRQYLRGLKHTDKAPYLIGIMAGTVSAMYDLGSPMAWQYRKALYKVERIYAVHLSKINPFAD